MSKIKEVSAELKRLYKDDFRPENWKERVNEKLSKPKSEDLINRVLNGSRYNVEVAIAIISLFNSEKKLIQNLIKEAKK